MLFRIFNLSQADGVSGNGRSKTGLAIQNISFSASFSEVSRRRIFTEKAS
jgi:hypothetical protein